MRMYKDDIEKYKKFSYYVSTTLPTVINSETIISAIFSLAQLVKGKKEFNDQNLKDALVWGNGPMIKIGRTLRDGYVWSTNPNVICIRRKWVKEFEAGTGKKRTTKWSNKVDDVDFIEVVLLHELTHWADLQDGKGQRRNDIEVGWEFEKLIYTDESD